VNPDGPSETPLEEIGSTPAPVPVSVSLPEPEHVVSAVELPTKPVQPKIGSVAMKELPVEIMM